MTTLALLAGYAGGLLTGIILTALFVSQPARRAKKKRQSAPTPSILEALRQDGLLDAPAPAVTDPKTARFIEQLRAANQATYAKERREDTLDRIQRRAR